MPSPTAGSHTGLDQPGGGSSPLCAAAASSAALSRTASASGCCALYSCCSWAAESRNATDASAKTRCTPVPEIAVADACGASWRPTPAPPSPPTGPRSLPVLLPAQLPAARSTSTREMAALALATARRWMGAAGGTCPGKGSRAASAAVEYSRAAMGSPCSRAARTAPASAAWSHAAGTLDARDEGELSRERAVRRLPSDPDASPPALCKRPVETRRAPRAGSLGRYARDSM
eukprot:scaffold1046_cov118-Isochrysis_galbana.AAC.10